MPIDACGPGTHEEWVCDAPVPLEEPPCPDPNDCEPPPPPPEECFPVCVPDGGECPPELPATMACDENGCVQTCGEPPPEPGEPGEPPPVPVPM